LYIKIFDSPYTSPTTSTPFPTNAIQYINPKMSSAAGSSAPPPPPGGGPGKGFGPSHNISKTNIPRNGDGSSAQTAKFSITLERNPAQQPQFVIRPVSRLEPWIRTNEAEARYAAESGQQVFHGHNGQPVTAWTPPLRGVQPNTAFYAHNEMTVKVEQGFAASGEYLGEEDVLGESRRQPLMTIGTD
jgi:hypothetical protein